MKSVFLLLALSSTAFAKDFTVGALQTATLECLAGVATDNTDVTTEPLMKSILCQANPEACVSGAARFHVTRIRPYTAERGMTSLPIEVTLNATSTSNKGIMASVTWSKSSPTDLGLFNVTVKGTFIASFRTKGSIPYYTWAGVVADSGFDDFGRSNPTSLVTQTLTIKTPEDMGADVIMFNISTNRATKLRLNFKDYVYCLESKVQ